MRKILTLVLAAGLFLALPPTHSQAEGDRAPVGFAAAAEAARHDLTPDLVSKQDGCVGHVIGCGQTIQSRITTNDCATDPPPIYFDVWFFDGIAGQTITGTMSSDDFNPYLILFDPEVEIVAEDDDSGPGDAARIQFTIDETSPDWSFTATPLEENVTGDYTMSLDCSGQDDPPPVSCPNGFFSDSEYPDFCFRVEITPPGQPPIEGTREPDCLEDTVCVSGALPGRSEVYVRILGPRPNGFLWPTITRFTPSKVRVDMHQISSEDFQTYTLDAVPPGEEDLSGLQDRTGFSP